MDKKKILSLLLVANSIVFTSNSFAARSHNSNFADNSNQVFLNVQESPQKQTNLAASDSLIQEAEKVGLSKDVVGKSIASGLSQEALFGAITNYVKLLPLLNNRETFAVVDYTKRIQQSVFLFLTLKIKM